MQTKQLYASVITLLLCFVSPASQRPRSTPASDFNIEITNLDDGKHFFSVPESPGRAGYIAHHNLKRIPEWKISEKAPEETNALRLQFWIEAGMPQIEVLAHLGNVETRPYEWNRQKTTKIVTRQLPVDETITITETAAFGIVPFQVRVSRAQPWSVGPPTITNKTQALTVLSLTESRPVYTLVVRNVSHKAINGIRWHGLENGRKQNASGISAAPLIAAGKPFEVRQRFGLPEEKLESQPADLQPASREIVPPSREIVIAAILFSDGTFEGDPDEAAEMAANSAGERIQLARVLRLLENMSGASEPEPARLKKLKNDVNALSEEADTKVAEELIAQFAEASEDMRNRRIKVEIARGLGYIKTEVIQEISKLERQREVSLAKTNFESWLKELISMLGTMSRDNAFQ